MELGEQIARTALGLSDPVMMDLPVAAGEAAPLVGAYRLAEVDQTLSIAFDGKALGVKRAGGKGDGLAMHGQGGGVFMVPELHARFRFELLPGRRVTHLVVHQGGLDIHGERVVETVAPPSAAPAVAVPPPFAPSPPTPGPPAAGP